MEKIIYALWCPASENIDDFNHKIRSDISAKLSDHCRAVRINLKDEDVADGTSPKSVATKPQMDAIVQLWVDTSQDSARAPIDEIIELASPRFSAWLVCESTPIVNTAFPTKEGERLSGFSQIVFLKRPENMTWQAWRDTWQNHHTKPAIDTQSNFEYQQNLVIRSLTYAATSYDAIIEECFPQEALNDITAYFDAPGDMKKMESNLKIMMDSVARFIDHSRMDCFPSSQYDMKKLFT